MSENDYHDQVLGAPRDLQVSQAATTSELKGAAARLDSTVAHHQEDTGRLQIELAESRLACPLVDHVKESLTTHILGCPMKSTMGKVEDFVAGGQGGGR